MPQSADIQTRALLEAMAQSKAPKLYELPVGAAREALRAAAKSMEIERHGVGAVKDVNLTHDLGEFAVRVYTPPAVGAAPLPVLIFFHGGGFLLGDVESYDTIMRYLCVFSGRKVVGVNYRLAPEHPFPAGLNDCAHAVEWVFDNAGVLDIDRNRVSLAGDSAGANLAAGVVQMTSRALESLILLYPCCDLSDTSVYPSRQLYGGGDYFLSMKDMDWILSHYAPDQAPSENSLLSPLRCSNFSTWPPTLLLTAGLDMLRDEAHELAKRLRAAGVNCDSHCYNGTIHGFVSFAGTLDKGRQCLDRICAYLKTS